jgi:hypothetical protein
MDYGTRTRGVVQRKVHNQGVVNHQKKKKKKVTIGYYDPAGAELDDLPPVKAIKTLNDSVPLTAKIRWVALAILIIALVAGCVVLGLLLARDLRRQHRLEAAVQNTKESYQILADLVGNLTAPPNCSLVTNFTATSNFSSALFAIYDYTNPSAKIQFGLSALDSSNQILWKIQDEDGIIAYLSDIPPISAVFKDNVFVVQNAADPTKQVMLNVGSVGANNTVVLSVRDLSGTIALLSDIPTEPNVYLDDVFAVQNADDTTKEVMLDVSTVPVGTTVVMTVQDKSGVILLLENITNSGPPFSDADFIVYKVGDTTAQAQLNLSLVSSNNNVSLSVQDNSGVVAYLSDIPQIVEVLVTTTRSFPDVAYEGVANLTQLGTIKYIDVSVCGGGGGGGSGANGGGGGSGSAHENFRIYTPSVKYYRFSCTIGSGGSAGSGGSSGGDGNYTILEGESDTFFYLYLQGFGGGGGEPTTAGGAAGGAGGGGGSNAVGTTPGDAGKYGGLVGGDGGLVTGSNVLTDAKRGEINLSWRAGGGGSAATGSPVSGSVPAAWNGGYATNITLCDGSTGCGAASMLAAGGVGSSNPDGGLCAGGGSAGTGGDGACVFRYYLV